MEEEPLEIKCLRLATAVNILINKAIENNWFTSNEFKEIFDKDFESDSLNLELEEIEKSGIIKKIKE